MSIIFGLLIYAGLIFAIVINGKQRIIGNNWSLYFAIVCPLIGIILTMYSPKIEDAGNKRYVRSKMDILIAIIFFALAVVFIDVFIEMVADPVNGLDIPHSLLMVEIILGTAGAGLYKLRVWNKYYPKNSNS